MSMYFYRDVPEYYMASFCAVRNSFDNFINVLKIAEIINTCNHCLAGEDRNGFDIAIFTGEYKRVLIKKSNGYFSMSIPFQVIENEKHIVFSYDPLEEEVSGRFISVMRNIINTIDGGYISHEDIILSLTESFNLNVQDAVKYYDSFASLISDDHGYFRFDDDVANARGNIHPRYHVDVFYKNTTSIKIGCHDKDDELNYFYSLVDCNIPKKYLANR